MPNVEIPLDRIAVGSLPPVCVVCGAAAEGRYFATVGQWFSPWTASNVVGRFLLFWSYTLCNGGRSAQSGGLPFCARHRRYWPRRAWVIFGGIVLSVGIALAGVWAAEQGYAGTENGRHWLTRIGAFGLLIHMPACVVFHCGAMRPIQNSSTSLILTGVAPLFAEALTGSATANPPKAKVKE